MFASVLYRARYPLLLLALVGFFGTAPTSAHPADELLQHLQLDLAPDRLDLTITIGGGPLAKAALIAALDTDGDGASSPAEIAVWQNDFVSHLNVSIDQRPLLLDPDKSTVTVPDLRAFELGTKPIQIRYQLPALSPSGVEQLLSVTNAYRALKSTYIYDVSTSGGIGIVTQGWPSSEIRVVYGLGIGTPAAKSSASANALATTALGQRAAKLFDRKHTPTFFLILLGTFAGVGALHAAQPGHGKTLVAGYLVATQGTMRDAVALASIVTFTHTAGVFALGGVTIAASAIFLPSKVVPLMQILSALLVILLGLNLIRRALVRPSPAPEHHHDHDEHHHHHHDHAHLSDEEHARIHLEEALALRERTSTRDLLTLGIAGGIVPCPEALAILLLAIGLHQAWLGMISIVAFSLGLATVLVAFGAGVALLQTHSSALLQRLPGGSNGALGALTTRATRWLPAASAILITAAGALMLLAQLA